MDLHISLSNIPSFLHRFFFSYHEENDNFENEENDNSEEEENESSEQISIPLFTIEQNTQEYILKSFLTFIISSIPYVFILLLLFIYLNYKSNISPLFYFFFNCIFIRLNFIP